MPSDRQSWTPSPARSRLPTTSRSQTPRSGCSVCIRRADVSAAGGQVLTSRDTLAMGIKAFWQNVGANMREPKWVWDQMMFDVLSPTAAVMTAQYHVPHLTPRNQPHTIGGAWTAVFQKREGRWYIIQEHLSDTPAAPDSAVATPTPMPPGMKMPPGHKMP